MEYAIVLYAKALETLHAVIVHLDREIHNIHALGFFQKLHQASFKAFNVIRRAIELLLADTNGI
jgi:hypothetical protein